MQHIFSFAPVRRCAAFALGLWLLAVGPAFGFGFDDVARAADRVARMPWREPAAGDPAVMALGYDAVRRQRFKAERSTWRVEDSTAPAMPYELQYFPLGNGIVRPLAMFEVVDDSVRPIVVPADAFEHGASAGAAGWRLNRWTSSPPRSDEVAAFLGASYFRVVAPGLRYGASARGLAVDTVGGTGAEEFPAFTTFWVVRPRPGDPSVQAYALLESRRVTGAYAFVLRPGASTTTVEVRARLTLREPVGRLAIAPLTSMFLAGEVQPMPDDYRPEVHDSDGLQIAGRDGEWLWRPLGNPAGVFLTGFAMTSPRGFGLMQRDRAFTSYHDLEARYELRPSLWIEPIGDWGPGRVELLQFHSPDETHDNVGAWWLPDRLPAPFEPVEYAWRMTVSERQPLPPGAYTVQSRRGHGWRAGPTAAQRLKYEIDFAGPSLEGLADGEVEAVASADTNARALRASAYPNPAIGGWRVSLEFERADPELAVELRLFLRRAAGGVGAAGALTETWSHALPPH